jgi:hypothetical protein
MVSLAEMQQAAASALAKMMGMVVMMALVFVSQAAR